MSAPLALEPGPDPLIGRILHERYRIASKLGEGGMGAVYEGEHLLIRKRVAIKVLHPQFASSVDIVARFHQEALAATAIGHENIVQVSDLGRTPDGGIYMVLELLDGQDFAKLIEHEGRLSIGRVVHVVMQVCEGVQAAHDKGIIHRDLKPENIFIVKRGNDPDFAKVLDFGISKMQEGGPPSEGARASTKTGSIIGTAYYMSPEQAQGMKTIDHRTDVWSLGVILFRALTGRYPFDDDAYPMLILKICAETAPRVRSLRPDVPLALDEIVSRCLERDVAARIQSCAELRELIRPFESLTAPPPSRLEHAFADTRPVETPRAILALAATPSSPSRPGHVTSGVRSTSASRWVGRAAIGTVVSVALGGAAWTAVSRGAQSAAEPTQSAARSPSVASPTASTESVHDETLPSEALPAAEPRLEFIVSPSDAVVLVDGRPISPDSHGSIVLPVSPEDRELHELRVEARGFRSRLEDLRLSYPQRIVFALDPGSDEDDRRASHSAHGATRRPLHPTLSTPPTGTSHPVAPPLLTTEDP